MMRAVLDTNVLRRAQIVHISSEVEGVATHPEDDAILATALSASADFLVTGGRDLLDLANFRGIQNKSPRDFLSLL